MEICTKSLNISDLTGEQEDRNFFTTRGDARISLQIAKNKYTSAFGRSNRFLIDDEDSPHKMSFLLTKPLKTGSAFSAGGTFKFVLQEVTATEFDNHELGIADYYHHFPKIEDDNIESGKTEDSKDEQSDGKKVWI